MTRITIASLLAITSVACTNAAQDDAVTRTKDVRVACELRAGWTRTTACEVCVIEVKQPVCDCQPMSGKCRAESAPALETCTSDVLACAFKCADDCACVDACYAGFDACRDSAGVMDGCVAAACDDVCR